MLISYRLGILLVTSCSLRRRRSRRRAVADEHAAEPPTNTPAPVPTVWSGDKPPFGFTGGAESQEALIDQFLAGLTAGDLMPLNRLRVTKEEYGEHHRPRHGGQGAAAAYDLRQGQRRLLRHARQPQPLRGAGADRPLQGQEDRPPRDDASPKPIQEWLWYTAHGELRLVLFDDAGERYEMKSGWIAEVDGRYKFIGFNWDN